MSKRDLEIDLFSSKRDLLTLAYVAVRFYPRPLSAANVQEIYQYGSTLPDISTGATTFNVGAMGLPAVQKSLEGSVSQVHSAVASRQNEIEIGQISELGAQQSAVEDDAPDFDGAGAHYLEMDGDLVSLALVTYNKTKVATAGRTYHPIFSGPNGVGILAFYNIPKTPGGGVTLSFWYKHVACPVKECQVFYVCACVCVCVCVCTYIRMYIHTNIYIYTHTHIYIYIYVYT